MKEKEQEQINTFVSDFFLLIEQKTGFSREKIQSNSREQKLVYMRQCIGHILYENMDISLAKTGQILKRDHATVIFGMKPKNSEGFTKKYLETYNELYQLFVFLMESVLSDPMNFTGESIAGDKIYSPFFCNRNVGFSPFDESLVKQIIGREHKKYLRWKAHIEPGSEIEKKILFDYENNATQSQLMKKYEISGPLLIEILGHNLGENYKSHSLRRKTEDGIVIDFKNGLSIKAIEEKYNNKNIRYVLLKSLGRGYTTQSPSHSYKNELKNHIVNYYKEGLLTKEIALKVGKGERSVRGILIKETGGQYISAYRQALKDKYNMHLEKFMVLAKELNRIPRAKEYAFIGKISADNFSKMRKAALQAGYAKVYWRPAIYNKEQLLEDLKSLAAKLGRTPSGADLNNVRRNLRQTYIRKFGNLSIAQNLAGLIPNAQGNSRERVIRKSDFITVEQCIEELKNLHQNLGHKPTLKEVKAYCNHDSSFYKRRLGNAITDYVQYKRLLYPLEYSTEEKELMLDYLKESAQRSGHMPSASDLRTEKKYTVYLYKKCFGSLKNARKLAGLESLPYINKRMLLMSVEEKKEKLLADLKDVAERLGHTPNGSEIIKEGKYSPFFYRTYFGSWTNAQKEAGLVPSPYRGRRIVTSGNEAEVKKALLDNLKEIAQRLGHTPNTSEIKKEGKYSFFSYRTYFGSWSNAQKEAGLEPTQQSGRRIVSGSIAEIKEALLDDLKEIAQRLGHTPNSSEMKKEGMYSPFSYRTYFGSWSNAQKEAGFVPTLYRGRRIVASGNAAETKEALLDNLKEIVQRLGHAPNTKEINTGKYSLTPYRKYFGTLGNAMVQAGLTPNMSKRVKSASLPAEELQAKNVLLNHLKDLAHRLQHTPSAIEMDKKGDYTYLVYKKYFGSWKQAQILAELKLNPGGLKRIADKGDISQIKKILIDEIIKIYRNSGHVPTVAEMTKYGKYTGHPFYKYFGTWNKALIAAELEPKKVKKA